MIKSSNVQLKAREKDSIRLKSKLVHLEGKNLAKRQLGSLAESSKQSTSLRSIAGNTNSTKQLNPYQNNE